jgi:hypothetical protein
MDSSRVGEFRDFYTFQECGCTVSLYVRVLQREALWYVEHQCVLHGGEVGLRSNVGHRFLHCRCYMIRTVNDGWRPARCNLHPRNLHTRRGRFLTFFSTHQHL